MSNHAQARAWIEVNASALRANFEAVQARVGAATAIIPMVKADGYGLGARWVVRQLEPLGPWGFGVATAPEGAALRAAGVQRPILVCSPQSAEALEQAAENGLIVTISDLDSLERWASLAEQKPLEFHLEIDTGMGRAGFDWRETGVWGERVRAFCSERLRWAGVYTHFHGADAADRGPAAAQWERFRDALSQLPVSTEDLMVHAANSAAAIRWPEFAADAVRPGIFLYGGQPAPRLADVPAHAETVATLHARVTLVRQVPPGSTVGYGATHVARGPETWATVAIGYGDGWPRGLSNRGAALIRGHRVRVVGRISMDMTVVDVTGLPGVRAGDEVMWIGRAGDEEITVDEVAAQLDTISYEILTGFTPRLPRVERP
ncbi:MAG TPA: alanine racemase [Longimicrobiales bacterium]|nr:alanine racemase [Longimicrobiales bacterium]